MSRSNYLRNLEQAVKDERAYTKNLLTKQGKTVSELLLQDSRQKQFAPVTSEVKALQLILRETTEAVRQAREVEGRRAERAPLWPHPLPAPAVVVAQPAVAAAPPVAQPVAAAPAAKEEYAAAASSELSTYFDELENSPGNRDRIFGLVAFSNREKTSEFRFGFYDVLDRSKYIKPIEHMIEISFADNSLVVN